MALEEYLGAIVVEVDGQEVEVFSVDARENTGRKLVKTMNRSGRAKGFSRGIAQYDLTVTVPYKLRDNLNWAGIEGAKITIYPLESNGLRESYLDCFSIEVGRRYEVDNEARFDVTMAALRKVEE